MRNLNKIEKKPYFCIKENFIMHTIRLKISDKVYDKLIWLLSKFNKDEIEIVSDTENYTETKEYLENELNEILNGKASFHTLEEFDKNLEDTIRANETQI